VNRSRIAGLQEPLLELEELVAGVLDDHGVAPPHPLGVNLPVE
jgi:hypothetical protein